MSYYHNITAHYVKMIMFFILLVYLITEYNISKLLLKHFAKLVLHLVARKQLHNLPNDKVLYILGNLNKKHSMKFTDKHIKKIASKNDFNLNASVNVMQKIHLSDKYSDHSINENATTINYDVIQKYFTLLYNNKHHDALHILIQLYENGFSTHDIYNVFYKYFTSYDNILDINNISNKYNFLTLICKYIQNNVKIIDSKLELYFFSNDLYNETSLIQN
jgi:hypothetical protein